MIDKSTKVYAMMLGVAVIFAAIPAAICCIMYCLSLDATPIVISIVKVSIGMATLLILISATMAFAMVWREGSRNHETTP